MYLNILLYQPTALTRRRLVLPMEMWNKMYEVLHVTKYELFTSFGISKLAYGGFQKKKAISGQEGCHYTLFFNYCMNVVLSSSGTKYFQI